MSSSQPDFLVFENGQKAPLSFSHTEYENRLRGLRAVMNKLDLDAILLTSMHGVAYYTGFLYCSFGRPYGCLVTGNSCTTISANIDGGQPWRRSVSDNIVYTDWQRGNFWRAIRSKLGSVGRLGIEGDHLTLNMRDQLVDFLDAPVLVDIAPESMQQRMRKSDEELALIRTSAEIADVAAIEMCRALRAGASEVEIAQVGRHAIEVETAAQFPDSEVRDSWVWLQSGPNTDGAHNPLTTRTLRHGDILSLNVFPMVSGYYTALERTLFLGEPDAASLAIWEANVGAHELGLRLIRPGARCSEICAEINTYLDELGLLQYRSFGYGHSFGMLSHYYGREAGLELREDVHTVLEPGMVVSMEPMLTIPEGAPGAGGYREHDILIVTGDSADNITGFPYGPEHNIMN